MPDNPGGIMLHVEHLQGDSKAGFGQRLISIPTDATLDP
jgi:hypothetical protein